MATGVIDINRLEQTVTKMKAETAPVIHTHSADQITAGTLPVGVKVANGTDYGVARVRNIYAGTADMTPGVTPLANGDIYLVYEE